MTTIATASRRTTSHDTIRRWAEERGGRPATARSGSENPMDALRITFEDLAQEGIDPISWNEFFRRFEAARLELLYREQTQRADKSRFCKLVARSA